MNILLNHTNEELSTELADTLVAPILDVIEIVEENDETARAIITLIRVVAREPDPGVRESFVDDLATKIFAKTTSCRMAALSFAA